MKKASISVIIPCYGHSKTLFRALSSVNEQTLPPIEVIIVNDGGPKNAETEISGIVSKFPFLNISLVNLTKNVGPGQARNIGWDIASSEFIAFLDADDSWHPSKLDLQSKVMLHYPMLALCGHGHIISPQKYCSTYNYETLGFREIDKWEMLIKNPFITPSIMVRSSINIRFSSTQRYCEDYQLWMRASFGGLNIGYINAPLAKLYKPSISNLGLSSQTLKMSLGELKAYSSIASVSYWYSPLLLILIPYSLIKFIRRCILRIESIFHSKYYE